MKILKFLILVCLISSCSEIFNVEPYYYLSCRVDGKKWTPYVGVNFSGAKAFSCTVSNILIQISARNLDSNESIGIRLTKFTGKGKYELGEFKTGNYASFDRKIGYAPITTYSTNSVEKGELVIEKIDFEKKQISGSFNFKVKENGGTQIITFTKGNFDLKQ